MTSRVLRLIALSVLVASTAVGDLYVANPQGTPAVTIYVPGAAGNTAPSRKIQGAATGLVNPQGVTVNELHKELIVADYFGQAVRVYPLNANGNVPPVRTLIHGPKSGLIQPRCTIVDISHDELIVASNFSIRTYKRLATGDFAPKRVISGSNTELKLPMSLALDRVHDELIVTTVDIGGGHSGILVFPRTASGNVPPVRKIGGPNTELGINGATVAFDPVTDEYVARPYSLTNPGLFIFPRMASGNVLPARRILGPKTGLGAWGHVAVDLTTGRYMTAEYSSPYSVRSFKREDSGDVAPQLVLQGAATELNAPLGLDTGKPGW